MRLVRDVVCSVHLLIGCRLRCSLLRSHFHISAFCHSLMSKENKPCNWEVNNTTNNSRLSELVRSSNAQTCLDSPPSVISEGQLCIHIYFWFIVSIYWKNLFVENPTNVRNMHLSVTCGKMSIFVLFVELLFCNNIKNVQLLLHVQYMTCKAMSHML